MSQAQTRRFDGWVLRADVGELAKEGRKIRLQDQPLQVLDELLCRPGELVTREQLIARLWPKGVVDFDTGLNSAVRKLRVALQDEADTPRYIETVPRKGYRFIGSIDPLVPELPLPHEPASPATPAVAALGVSAGELSHAGADASSADRVQRLHIYVATGIAGVLIAAAVVFGLRHEPAAVVAVAPAPQAEPVALDTRTLAVLPLRTAAADEASVLLAQSLTDLIRNRLAASKDLVVIASSSTAGMTYSPAGMRTIGEKLRTRFLLAGGAERVGERLHMDVQLIDAESGKQLWSTTFDRPLVEIAQIREQLYQGVAGTLGASVDPNASNASARAAISLDAYQLYMRAQQLLANQTISDVEMAIELFQRATILDPGFARAYVGHGQAQLLALNLGGGDEADRQLAAQRAFDRALELNPALGEAWVARAHMVGDPVEAETFYRKGLEYAPNYGAGYASFADFLFREGRTGEAINMVDRARAIDPLTPTLHLHQAFFLMVTRSDVAAHDQLVLEALAINPKFQPALQQLAQSRWEYSADFADAARIIEQSIALDPDSAHSRSLATRIYLDLRDPDAARAVRGDSRHMGQAVDILQYRRDQRRAAEVASDLPVGAWSAGSFALEAEAIRDGAVATGDYASALALLESAYATVPRAPRMWSRYLAMVYAHALLLAGETERARKLATSTLSLIDSHSVGRKEHWFARERAAAYMVLGEDDRALDELAAAVGTRRLYRWWYTSEVDPLFERLRRNPRFIALNEQATKHIDAQRALLEEMRRKGEVPRRHSVTTAGAKTLEPVYIGGPSRPVL